LRSKAHASMQYVLLLVIKSFVIKKFEQRPACVHHAISRFNRAVPLSALKADRNTHISREIVTRIRAIPAKPHYTFTPSSVRRSGKGRPVKTAIRFLSGAPLRKDVNSREKEKERERERTLLSVAVCRITVRIGRDNGWENVTRACRLKFSSSGKAPTQGARGKKRKRRRKVARGETV